MLAVDFRLQHQGIWSVTHTLLIVHGSLGFPADVNLIAEQRSNYDIRNIRTEDLMYPQGRKEHIYWNDVIVEKPKKWKLSELSSTQFPVRSLLIPLCWILLDLHWMYFEIMLDRVGLCWTHVLDSCWIMLGICWIRVGFVLDLCRIYVGFTLDWCWIDVGLRAGSNWTCWICVGPV